MNQQMHAKNILEDLTRTLITTRDKAVLDPECLQVLPQAERNLLQRQIESCVQALYWLATNLDPLETTE